MSESPEETLEKALGLHFISKMGASLSEWGREAEPLIE